MKILFCGGKTWGARCLNILAESIEDTEHEIVGVVVNISEFDLPVYAEKTFEVAAKYKLPVFCFSNQKQLSEISLANNVDILISVFYDSIFPGALMEMLPYGAINLHMGDAELYRGCFSTIHSIINEDEKVGVTLHYIDEGIDTGDIIDKATWALEPNINGYDLYIESMKKGVDLFEKNIVDILNRKNSRRVQSDDNAVHNPRVLPKKNFSASELIEDPRLFLNSAKAYAFDGFHGVDLNIEGNVFEIKYTGKFSK